MSHDSNQRPNRSGSNQDLWPKWMWIAVPVLVVVVVAGLWWAIFSPSEPSAVVPTPTATVNIIQNQPTQAPTAQQTLTSEDTTPTRQVLPELPTFTPTAVAVTTPTGEPTQAPPAEMVVGAKVSVTGTNGAGLNMRSGAGTANARVKTLSDGTEVEIIGGPKDANGYTWWQIRDSAGTTGWVASQFLMQK